MKDRTPPWRNAPPLLLAALLLLAPSLAQEQQDPALPPPPPPAAAPPSNTNNQIPGQMPYFNIAENRYACNIDWQIYFDLRKLIY